MTAVSGPAGIAHLEDPKVLDDLALAQGQLTGQMPADAPMTLALVVSNRASGLIACAVLASWRWWLGLGMLALWVIIRRPQLELIREQGALYAGGSQALRRAWYLQRLAALPPVAKESRVFGLGGWLVDRYRSQWLLGMAAPWAVLRRLDRKVLLLSAAGAGRLRGRGRVPRTGRVPPARSPWARWPSCCRCWRRPRRSATSPGTTWPWPGCCRGCPGSASWKPRSGRPEPICPAISRPLGGPRARSASSRCASAIRAPSGTCSRAWTSCCGRAGRRPLVGINGAGKTTLVKLLARLHDPVAGRILVDGIDLARLSPAQWQRQVAVVFQDFAHYPLSVSPRTSVSGRPRICRRHRRARPPPPPGPGPSRCFTSLGERLGDRACPGITRAELTCPAGNGSGSRSPAPCSRCVTGPESWSWTSRPRGWTPGARPISSTGSLTSPRAPPR